MSRPFRSSRAWWGLALLLSAATAASGCSSADPATAAAAGYCRQLVVPAYFYASSTWAQASDSKPPPGDIILDISGVGAGSAPLAHFKAVVSQARARGVTVLGYISTVDGQRPVAQVETEVRNYRAWYGVTDIFLDRVSGQQQQVAYYRQLASYIHQYDAGSSVWLNPGDFPARAYMSIGDVVMVFEGTYAQYLTFRVPGWAYKYPAAKFADTIYQAPVSSVPNALDLAVHRQAGHVYITDGSGANPYAGLPSYWSYEVSAASAGCPGG